MARPRKYPPELLDRGARVVIESGRPIAHVARDLGVPAETLRRTCVGWRPMRGCARMCRRRPSARRSGRCAGRVEDERLLRRIGELHAANYDAYGYRRMWKALLRTGEPVSRCRVRRLIRAHGIVGAKRRGRPWRTTRPDPDAPRRPDLVQRDFTASRPDQLWVADLCYLRCWDGLVFFAFVIDAYSRRVVGRQLANHMRTTLVLDALRMALGQRRPGADVALVQHSDRGSQPGLKEGPRYTVLRW